MRTALTTAQAALTDAIRTLVDAEAYVAKLDARLQWSPSHRDPLRAAEEVLAEAQEAEQADALARALGKPVSGPSVAEAQAAVDATRIRYDADERDRELIRQERARFATFDLSFATERRDAALAAIMEPVIAELVAEFQRLDARMAAIYQAINGLPVAFRPENGWSYRPASFGVYAPDSSISGPLAAWRDELQTSASAPAPDLSAPEPLAEAAE